MQSIELGECYKTRLGWQKGALTACEIANTVGDNQWVSDLKVVVGS